MKANAGQPTKANTAPRQATQVNDGQQQPTQAHDSPRFGFSLCFIHTNEILQPPGPTKTRPDPEGRQKPTQAHNDWWVPLL